jgi:hypothetical protein
VKIELQGDKRNNVRGGEKFSCYIIKENSPNLRPDKDSISGIGLKNKSTQKMGNNSRPIPQNLFFISKKFGKRFPNFF